MITDLADAIAEVLNDSSRPWANQFEAVRLNSPQWTREELKDLRVTVVPKKRVNSNITRGKSQVTFGIQVGFQKAMQTDCNEESDPLVAICEQVCEYFQSGVVLSVGRYAITCTEAAYGADDESTLFGIIAKEETMTFIGIVNLTFVTLQ